MTSIRGGGFKYILTASIGVAVLFALFLNQPYRIEGDIAYQAKAAQDAATGAVNRWNTLKLVDPRDLSKDVQTWLSFWPPGIAAIFTCALSAHLSLGAAARLLAFGATLSGTLGWTVVALRLLKEPRSRWLAVAGIVMYPIIMQLPHTLSQGDPFSFAILPWLYYAVILLSERARAANLSQSFRQFYGLAFAAGAVYWLKYSTLLITIGLMLSATAIVALAFRLPLHKRMLVTIPLGWALFALPILSLKAINASFTRYDWLETHLALGHAMPLDNVLKMGIQGLGGVLFGSEAGIQRVVRACAERGWGGEWVWLLKVPGFLLLVLLAIEVRKLSPWLALLAGLSILCPWAGLSLLTWRVGYDFLGHATRYLLPAWILLQILLIAVIFETKPRAGSSWVSIRRRFLVALAVYAVVASFWNVYLMVHWDLLRSRREHYQSTENRLYVPTLSLHDLQTVRKTVHNALGEPEDVVVLATPWLGQESWLEFRGRILPLSNFWLPLYYTHGRGANYFDPQPFRTSKDLNVVLVVSDLYHRSDYTESIQRIQNSFPQARNWEEVPLRGDPTPVVRVWRAALKVTNSEISPSTSPMPTK